MGPRLREDTGGGRNDVGDALRFRVTLEGGEAP